MHIAVLAWVPLHVNPWHGVEGGVSIGYLQCFSELSIAVCEVASVHVG